MPATRTLARDMSKPIFVLNGPNLNMLGLREPAVYGHATLDDIARLAKAKAAGIGLTIEFRQSNSEGELVGWIQEARDKAAGIILNAGAFTHTSIGCVHGPARSIHAAARSYEGGAVDTSQARPMRPQSIRVCLFATHDVRTRPSHAGSVSSVQEGAAAVG